ncbi:hypothetical protein RUND412_005148 [Rhizina undulata]
MKTFFVSVFVLLASTVTSALPAPVAEPEALEARQTIAVLPTLTIPIYQDDPDTAFGNGPGIVQRINDLHNIQTLIAIQFTQGYPGQKCQLRFKNPSDISGVREAQVFTLGGPVTEANTYNSRPYRNVEVGWFGAAWGLEASWIYYGDDTFNCPSSPTTLNYELVPVNDNDYVSWDVPNGFYIAVL